MYIQLDVIWTRWFKQDLVSVRVRVFMYIPFIIYFHLLIDSSCKILIILYY